MLVALRPLGNELISMIKASALAAIVTLLDLMGQTRFVFARTFDFSVYLYAALIYLAITETDPPGVELAGAAAVAASAGGQASREHDGARCPRAARRTT